MMVRPRSIELRSADRQLVVGCPQRIDPVPLRACAACELCEGISLGDSASVHCAAVPDVPGVDRFGRPTGASPVASIMTSPAILVTEDAAIENVQWLLLDRGIGAVPVVDATGRAVGLLSMADLLRRDEATALDARLRDADDIEGSLLETSGLCARDVMTPVVRSLPESASIAAAAALMAREHLHHVLVVSDAEHVVGVVSTLDIARWVAARECMTPRTSRAGGET